MRRTWIWIPVTTVSLIVMLCGHRDAGAPIIDRSSVGRSHARHHHAVPRSEAPSM